MPNKELNVELPPEPGKPDEEIQAKFITSPQVNAAAIQREFSITTKDNLDLMALTGLLSETCRSAVDGSSKRGSMMLAAQAEALNAIFTKLATRASANMDEGYVGATETYLRLALKAQNQSKATLEALSRVQNPRVASYVGQLNATTGPQQVSNVVDTRLEKSPNEVLEVANGERLDRGAQGATVEGNSEMEAMVPRHRAANS